MLKLGRYPPQKIQSSHLKSALLYNAENTDNHGSKFGVYVYTLPQLSLHLANLSVGWAAFCIVVIGNS